jgi:hypothetical protein
LLTSVRVVLLLGREARRSWTLFSNAHPDLAAELPTVDTRHTSTQAFITRDPVQREQWRAEQLQAFETIATIVRGAPAEPWVTTEASVVTPLCTWLRSEGWEPRMEVDYADIVATRGNERLIVEAKGRTSDASLDADAAYSQILRHMTSPKHGQPDDTQSRHPSLRAEQAFACRLRSDGDWASRSISSTCTAKSRKSSPDDRRSCGRRGAPRPARDASAHYAA